MNEPCIYPVLLAAGSSTRLGDPELRTRLGGRNALEVAVENCIDLQQPIVVLGYQAATFSKLVPSSARLVINRRWRSGQLGSLLAGLQLVPRDAAFLLYPADLFFLTRGLVRGLVLAFKRRTKNQEIIMPQHRGRAGHPVIFSPAVRDELGKAATARDVVYRKRSRLLLVSVDTPAIWKEYAPPRSERTA
jgi:CTP:molybdopterin cytidylyltransferase MocA